MSASHAIHCSARLLVVTYHYVRDRGGPYPGIHPISAKKLRQQILMLLHSYTPGSVEDVTDFALGRRPLARDSFLITFDDGLCDHFFAAREVLNDLGIKGAFFVPTRPLGCAMAPAVHKVHWLRANIEPSRFHTMLTELLPREWAALQMSEEDKKRAAEMHIHDTPETQQLKYALNFLIPYDVIDTVTSQMLVAQGMTESEFCRMTFMDANQIRTLASEGHIVGMHGHGHAPLSSLDSAKMEEDVAANSETLSEILGKRPAWLSYPYGRPDALPADPLSLCLRHGIEVAFTLVSGFNNPGISNAMLKRITPNELGAFVNGTSS